MPRFHFNIYDGGIGSDLEGTDLPSARVAGLQAIMFAGEVLKSEATKRIDELPWHLEVTDEEGRLHYRLDFKLTSFPIKSSNNYVCKHPLRIESSVISPILLLAFNLGDYTVRTYSLEGPAQINSAGPCP